MKRIVRFLGIIVVLLICIISLVNCKSNENNEHSEAKVTTKTANNSSNTPEVPSKDSDKTESHEWIEEYRDGYACKGEEIIYFCKICGETKRVICEPTAEHLPSEKFAFVNGFHYKKCSVWKEQLEGVDITEKIKISKYSYVSGDGESHYALYDQHGCKIYVLSNSEKMCVVGDYYFMSTENSIYYLKDTLGNVIFTSESLGVSGFGMSENFESFTEFLNDGYVLVYNCLESYNGVTYEIGVVDVDGDWIVPISADNPIINCGFDCSITNLTCKDALIPELSYAGDGCIRIKIAKSDYPYEYCFYNINTDKILYFKPETNIWTNTVEYMMTIAEFSNGVSYGMNGAYMYEFRTDGSSRIFRVIPKDYPYYERVDFYVDENGTVCVLTTAGIVDSSGKIIADFEEMNINLITGKYAKDHNCLLIMKNDQGTIYYALMDSNGNFIFNPIITDVYSIAYNGISVKTSSSNKISISIDSSGKEIHRTDMG